MPCCNIIIRKYRIAMEVPGEKKFKVSLCQIKVTFDQQQNLERATKMLETEAARADILVLPEMFTCPFGGAPAKYAEPIDSYRTDPAAKSMRAISEIAKKHGKYIIAGSIPELAGDGKVYNTMACFDRRGDLVAKYSKCHLFDVDVKGGIRCLESKYITPGDHYAVLNTEYCKIGLGICYDVRFPEFAAVLVQDPEVKVLCYAASFNSTTGPLHWDIYRRARAVDNQVYMLMCAPAPAPEEKGIYPTYGHSSVVSPWGKVLADAETNETALNCEIDLGEVDRFREQIPILLKHKRKDMYQLTALKKIE